MVPLLPLPTIKKEKEKEHLKKKSKKETQVGEDGVCA